MTGTALQPPEPDTKDWTWVLDEVCGECGFDAASVDVTMLGDHLRVNALGWSAVLTTAGASERPGPRAWSATEYACHVRDVHAIFLERLELMLERDEPTFANWDQDETALEQRYDLADPAVVAPVLRANAEAVAAAYDGVPDSAWGRRGVRSNGSAFTVDSLGRYHLHDVVHHLWDVRGLAARATVAAYEESAAAYGTATTDLPERIRDAVAAFAAAVGPGAKVLEIGSGSGRDALALETHGLAVRRTDITAAFVELMRSEGHGADLLDPLVDDLDGPWDGVWANACLLHVDRPDLLVVLTRLAGATRAGGVLRMSVKEGDGEGWSVHGEVRSPRRFVYWREPALREVLGAAGWSVQESRVGVAGTRGETWVEVTAVRT